MAEYSESQLFLDESSRYITTTFFATILKNNPSLLGNIFTDVEGRANENEQVLFINILWQINSEQSRKYLKIIEKKWITVNIQQTLEWVQTHQFTDLLNDEIKDPIQVDMLWAMFYATGDEEPILKIISILDWFKNGDENQKSIGAAAQMTLIDNAYEHRKIYHICKNQISKNEGLTQRILENIIKGVESKNNLYFRP